MGYAGLVGRKIWRLRCDWRENQLRAVGAVNKKAHTPTLSASARSVAETSAVSWDLLEKIIDADDEDGAREPSAKLD